MVLGKVWVCDQGPQADYRLKSTLVTCCFISPVKYHGKKNQTITVIYRSRKGCGGPNIVFLSFLIHV